MGNNNTIEIISKRKEKENNTSTTDRNVEDYYYSNMTPNTISTTASMTIPHRSLIPALSDETKELLLCLVGIVFLILFIGWMIWKFYTEQTKQAICHSVSAILRMSTASATTTNTTTTAMNRLQLSLDDRIELYNKTFDTNGNQTILQNRHIVTKTMKDNIIITTTSNIVKAEEEDEHNSNTIKSFIDIEVGDTKHIVAKTMKDNIITTTTSNIFKEEEEDKHNSKTIKSFIDIEAGDNKHIATKTMTDNIITTTSNIVKEEEEEDEHNSKSIKSFIDIEEGDSNAGKDDGNDDKDDADDPSISLSVDSGFDSTTTTTTRSLCLDHNKNRQQQQMINGTCIICFEDFVKDDRIVWSYNANCNHVYHQECMAHYLASNAQRTRPRYASETLNVTDNPCPTCRRPNYCGIVRVEDLKQILSKGVVNRNTYPITDISMDSLTVIDAILSATTPTTTGDE